MTFDFPALENILICPETRTSLVYDGERLVCVDPNRRLSYPLLNYSPTRLHDDLGLWLGYTIHQLLLPWVHSRRRELLELLLRLKNSRVVLGLLLLVGGGRRLIWTITAFTAGHSITLAMVTLGVFDYPVAFIEFLIALSIFVLALELTREGAQSWLWRQPWWLAGLFGLLHGMGFAGALADTGLPQANLPLALLFFNVGIEFGQLAFIAVLLGLGALFRRLLPHPPAAVLQLPVLVLGVLSAMWCIERGLEALS